MRAIRHTHRLRLGLILVLGMCAGQSAVASTGTGVPWVDNVGVTPFDGREELTRAQVADKQFRQGRQYFEQAREFEAKAREANTDARRQRLLKRAFSRYRASADMFAASLKRIELEDAPVDYLPQLHLEMADALYKTGQHADAVVAYRAATEVAPAFLNAHFGLARARLAVGDLAGVREGYAHLLREADTRGEAWGRLDALIDLIAAWQSHRDDSVAAPFDAFDQWFDAAREELSETVRWTALDTP